MLRTLAILLLTVAAGCNAGRIDDAAERAPVPAERRSAEPLRLAVIDDSALGEAIVRQWQAHSQDPVELIALTSEQALDELRRADVVVFPSRQLGRYVVENRIVPWPGDDRHEDTTEAPTVGEEYQWDDVLPWLRRRELRWGETLYGVSFGSPQLMLVYRSDLLTDWQLTPPSTWAEYEQLRVSIGERLGAAAVDSPPHFATLEPLSDGWAARCLLARAAAYAQHPNQYSTLFQFTTMEPWIDTPPFVRALEELVASVGSYPEDARSLAPDAVLARVLAGEAVMAITWPAAAGNAQLSVAPGAAFAIDALPGAEQVYSMSAGEWEPRPQEAGRRVPLLGISGRIGAVTRAARVPRAARDFLLWLTRPDVSLRLAGSSSATTLFRHSHATQPQLWVDSALAPIAGQYIDAMVRSHQQPSVMLMPRIPGEDRYLASLDEAVRQAVAGKLSAHEALSQVKQQWHELTDRLDLDRQRQAYESSLGLSP
jgi:multiple sugar transport system substrate-binding protein